MLTRDDLERRLSLALKIAKRAIGALGSDGYRDEAALEDSFGPDKPLAETAMFLYAARAVTGSARLDSQVDELLRDLALLARADRTAFAIALYPTICFQLGMPHILLTQLGLKDARFDCLLALSAEALAHLGLEASDGRLGRLESA